MTGISLFATLQTWITPLWLISVGVTIGLVVLLVPYGITWLVSRSAADRIVSAVKEGVLLPIFFLAFFFAGFCFLAAFQMPYDRLLESAGRISAIGPIVREVEVPATTADQEIDVAFVVTELKSYRIDSDQDVQISAKIGDEIEPNVVPVQAGDPAEWAEGDKGNNPFRGDVSALFITNDSDLPATVRLELITGVEYPQVYAIPTTAIAFVALVLIYMAIRFGLPKLGAIAAATSKQAIAQPVFYLALAIGAFALIAFIYVPYYTFGEDIKMLKTAGLEFMMVLSIIVAMWTASVSVADEIEGRTALTLLSKPISRRQFIIGKFLGIVWPILLLFIFLGVLFLATVSYKVVYDARETSSGDPTWQLAYAEMIGIVPGMVLAFLEAVVLASISVAISTRLPMLPNLIIVSSIYVLGNLVPMIVQSSVAAFPLVRFVGMLIATVLPVLDHFNIQAAVAAGANVPLVYLGWAVLYCILYSTIMMLLALFLFEDRDLA